MKSMADFSVLVSGTTLAILGIVLAGVSLKTWSGMIGKPVKSIDPNLIAFTFVIACITGIGIVAPSVDSWEEAIPVPTLLALIAGEILSIYGADSLYKGLKRKIVGAPVQHKTDNSPTA